MATRQVSECDLCRSEYDPSLEWDKPFHRIGLSDPPPIEPREEARLDAELKSMEQELSKTNTTEPAKAYYRDRMAVLQREAETRRTVARGTRFDCDLVCHDCFQQLQNAARQMMKGRRADGSVK